jgi:ferredoxin-like protein FixX
MSLLPTVRTNSIRNLGPVSRASSHSSGSSRVTASGGLECSLCHLACEAIGDPVGKQACHIACDQLVC